MKIIDLGCGKNKRKGSIGVDLNKDSHADLIHDLNSYPYPFRDSECDYIYLDNTLEHLDDTIKVMEEVYRILKPGGVCKVIVPYFRSRYAFIDPTHKKFFTIDSFIYFDPDNFYFKHVAYTKAKFKLIKLVFNENLKNSLFEKFLSNFAQKHPYFYENYLSHLIPLDDISYYLKKI